MTTRVFACILISLILALTVFGAPVEQTAELFGAGASGGSNGGGSSGVTPVHFGTCGDGVSWRLTSDGKLTIMGEGDMEWASQSKIPWREHKDIILNVIIENGVTNIGEYAFSNCDNLESVVVGQGVENIMDMAFRGCSITEIEIPAGVKTIGEGAFAFCAITNITIPESVTYIGNEAFNCCRELQRIDVDINNNHYSSDEYGVLFNMDKTVLIQYPILNEKTAYEIPNSVETILNHAFYESNIESVVLSKGVTDVGDFAFYGCAELEEIIIPGTVKSVGAESFRFCRNLESVTLQNGIEKIGECAFESCENITRIDIPSSVSEIGICAFACGDNLEFIKVDSNNNYYSNDNFGVLFNKDKTVVMQYPLGRTAGSYNIPKTVKRINDESFAGCENLLEITIPEGVEVIGDSAFAHCKFESVIIPESVTTIESGAFWLCRNMTKAVVPASVTNIESHTSFSPYEEFAIYGYAGSYVQEFAQQEDFNFVEITDIKGDIDFSGDFDINDLKALAKYLSGISSSLTDMQKRVADYYVSGETIIIDIRDLIALAKRIASN